MTYYEAYEKAFSSYLKQQWPQALEQFSACFFTGSFFWNKGAGGKLILTQKINGECKHLHLYPLNK